MALNYIPLSIPEDAEDLTFQVGYITETPQGGGLTLVEFIETSTRKPMHLYTECYPGDAYLTWLNSKGCWDYWLFGGEETRGIENVQEEIASQSNYGNFPARWEAAKTSRFKYRKLSARRGTVRSQPLTNEEVQAIAPLGYCVQAQRQDEDGEFQTILIEDKSFDFYRDRRKLNFLEFDYEISIRFGVQSQ